MAFCPKETILGSNTSTLSITEMGAVTARPEKCIGIHFLIPAALTPLVELVRGSETSDETHKKVIDFLTRCGKETVTVSDSPGFVINRLYLPMVNEAFYVLESSLANAEEIDRCCVRGLNFPLGPLGSSGCLRVGYPSQLYERLSIKNWVKNIDLLRFSLNWSKPDASAGRVEEESMIIVNRS